MENSTTTPYFAIQKETIIYMSSKHTGKHHPYCLNCHYPLSEFDKNCSQCGQKPTDGKVTMHDLVHEFTHTLFHIDGKIFSTIKHLFIPGKLTLEFFKGHHKRYAHPVQLFIVLGAVFLLVVLKLTHSSEEKLQKQIDKSDNKNVKKQILANLDSTARTLESYKTDPSVKKTVDALLQREVLLLDLDNISDLEKKYKKLKEHLAEQKFKVNYFYERVSLDTTTEKGKKLYDKFNDYIDDFDDYIKDSIDIVGKYAKIKGIPTEKAASNLDDFFVNFIKEEKAAGKKPQFEVTNVSDSGISFSIGSNNSGTKDLRGIVDDHIQNIVEGDSSTYITNSKRFYNFNKRVEIILNERKIEQLNSNQNNITLAQQGIDSMSILSTKIANKDLNDLTADEIIEKYKYEGYWKRLIVKASVDARKKGADKLHNFLSKSLWVIIVSLIPMAAFMSLMYRRQKRFFVEHVVWLIHFYCLLFLIFPILLLPSLIKEVNLEYVFGFFSMVYFIVPVIGFKVYYQQSWVKTLVKTLIFHTVYFFIAFFVVLFWAILSFLFL